MDLGEFRIEPLRDSTFRLDGGAMFGVVPRAIWEKTNPPDNRNRITLGINALLIAVRGIKILVDTGIGGKGDEKFDSIYGVERAPGIEGALRMLGLEKRDIEIVVNTHLHFDHAGGNTVTGPDGVLKPAFEKARHIIQKGELEDACSPNERTRASYRKEDFLPVKEAGLFDLIEGEEEIIKGVNVFRAGGHNKHMQLVKVSSGIHTALYLSDLVPTVTHLNYPYIAGYDLFPLETLEVKKELIKQADVDRWLLIFAHDPVVRAGYVRIEGGKPAFEKVL